MKRNANADMSALLHHLGNRIGLFDGRGVLLTRLLAQWRSDIDGWAGEIQSYAVLKDRIRQTRFFPSFRCKNATI